MYGVFDGKMFTQLGYLSRIIMTSAYSQVFMVFKNTLFCYFEKWLFNRQKF